MNEGNSGEVVGFMEHVISVLGDVKNLIFYVAGLLGASIYGYRLIRKFIWGRREAKEYLETLHEVERNYGQVAGIAEVLQRKSGFGNIDPEHYFRYLKIDMFQSKQYKLTNGGHLSERLQSYRPVQSQRRR